MQERSNLCHLHYTLARKTQARPNTYPQCSKLKHWGYVGSTVGLVEGVDNGHFAGRDKGLSMVEVDFIPHIACPVLNDGIT